MKKTPEQRAADFVEKRKRLVLATINSDGFPTASISTFVRYWHSYYVYMSALSQHTRDLLANPKVSIMFVEDEGQTPNPFASRRYTCPCSVRVIQQYSDEWANVIYSFEKKFGKHFAEIKPLNDFVLFELCPQAGRYVEGFGRAFHVGSELDWSEHITPENNDKS